MSLTNDSFALGKGTYRGSTFVIPGGFVINEKEGFFVDVFREITGRITKEDGTKFNLEVVPIKRSIMHFEMRRADIHFISVKRPQTDRYHSCPVMLKNDIIMTRNDRPIISSLKELEGKTVVLNSGYYYSKVFKENKKISISYSKSNEHALRRVAAGRVDAFVVPKRLGMKVLLKSGINNIHYSTKTPLFKHELVFVFQKTPDGKKLVKKFNQKTRDIITDGTYENIFKKYKLAGDIKVGIDRCP